jgi:hypothetical protein
MNIERTAVAEFWVGHGGADAVARPLVQRGYAPEKALKGVRVRAATANTTVVYVGPTGVTVESGYPLPAGEEVEVQIADVSKVYVTADPAGNSQQVVTLAGTVVGETFTLSLNGHATAPIATNAPAADVKTALEGLVGAGNVDISGDPGGPYTVEFKGALAKTDTAQMGSTDGGINARQTVAVTGGTAGDNMVLSYDGQSTAELAYDISPANLQTALRTLSSVNGANVAVTDGDSVGWVVEFIGALAKTDVPAMTGTCGRNEKQTVAVSGGAAGDKLVLTYDGRSTAELAYDISSADLQTALRALSSINGANVAVTDGDTAGWVVEFIGALAKTDVPAMTGTCGRNEKQTIVVTLAAAGDKLVLSYAGQSTAELAYDITSADLQTALRALSSINGANVAVTDGDPAGWVVEFIGTLAKTDMPAISGVCGKNEKQTVVVTGGAASDKLVLTYNGQSTAELAYDISSADMQTALRALSSVNGANVAVTDGDPAGWVVEFIGTLAKSNVLAITSVCGKNEKQTITLDSGVSDGTFTLTYDGQTTPDLAYNISAADMQTALRALSSINGANAAVTAGDPSGWVVEFIGTLAHTDASAITGDGTNLVGDVKTVTVVETVKGNAATVNVTETVQGHLATVNITETVKGNLATVGVTETVQGHLATVSVTMTQQGDAGFTVTVTKVADASAGSNYSWIAC